MATPRLHNVGGCRVRLRGVSLVSVPSAVHVTSVTAYLDGTNTIGMGTGDLLSYCRKQDRPYRMNDVVTPPHSDSAWYLVTAIRFAKPGP